MSEVEMVKMSPKGQLVVPKDIRELAGFEASDRFIPFPVKDGILFKRVKMPNLKEEYKKLAREIRLQFSENKITEADVEDAIKWARKK